jgi:hypothetical protein
MSNFLNEFLQSHRISLFIACGAAAILGVWSLFISRFASRVAQWPIAPARVENIFVDVSNDIRVPRTNAVMAYSYSVGGSSYSGQIRLLAGEWSLETLTREIVGQQISIQYDPDKPEASIFRMEEVHGWGVEKDRRLSVWTSIGQFIDKLP